MGTAIRIDDELDPIGAGSSLRTAVDAGLLHLLAAGGRRDHRRQRRAAAGRRRRGRARLLPRRRARSGADRLGPPAILVPDAERTRERHDRRGAHRGAHPPRRSARPVHRDLPPRVVPERPRDDAGQPLEQAAGCARRSALPPAPGRLLVLPGGHHPGGAARPARAAAPPTAAPSASTSPARTTSACTSRRAWPTASPRSPTW